VLQAMLRTGPRRRARLFAEAAAQLARIGMGEYLHELAGNLAMGPQRLMEIARALATDPALLLLDEPAAGLRHKEKQALADVLRQLKAEGMSMLLVEHDMDFVMQICRPPGGDGVRHPAHARHARPDAARPQSACCLSGHRTLMEPRA
jgi:branched-chain amino acid transport system permease protein